MNKDVIYIEPEEDITDILAKIKNAKTNIIALVPPKQASVLRSVVNFRLLDKVAQEANKSLVLVTADDSLVKLAAFVKMPVAKNLHSKPEVPGSTDLENDDDIIDDGEAEIIAGEEEEALSNEHEIQETSRVESVTASLSEDIPKVYKNDKKSTKIGKFTVPDLSKYRKVIIASAAALVLLIVLFIWAFAIAPAAKIAVNVRTKSHSISENVTFVKSADAANPMEGEFLLEEQKLVKTSSVEFEATSEVDKGAKAMGAITISRTGISNTNTLIVPKGTKFTVDGLSYISVLDVTLAAPKDGETIVCYLTKNCFKPGAISASVNVAAELPGEKYNLKADTAGWTSTVSSISVSSNAAITGGTSRLVKIISEDDIKKAKAKLESISESDGKSELMGNLPDSLIVINSSFAYEVKEAVSTPALWEELEAGKSAKLSNETTFIIYGIDRVKVSEYINAKVEAAIADEQNQKVYSTGVSENKEENKAFIESFREIDGKFTGKLKSTAQVGPEVTEQMIVEKALGRKVGEVQSILKSINGVSSVKIETSYFWVSSIPGDINKVSIEVIEE